MGFFGYEKLTDCPHCGTPRVGADYDNSYYVVPGRLRQPCEQGQHLVVTAVVYPAENDQHWVQLLVVGRKDDGKCVAVGATIDQQNFYIPAGCDPTTAPELERWAACPECGQVLAFQADTDGTHTTLTGHCPDRGKRPQVEGLPGCEHCNTEVHGGHFVD